MRATRVRSWLGVVSGYVRAWAVRRTAVLARVAPAVESVLCPGEEGAERESSPPLRGRRLYELSMVAPRAVSAP